MAQRSLHPRRKTYGNVCVKGRARVQLGDSQIINNYNISPDGLIAVIRSALANSNVTNPHEHFGTATDQAPGRAPKRVSSCENRDTTHLQSIEEADEDRVELHNSCNIARKGSTSKLVHALYEFIHRNIPIQTLSRLVLPATARSGEETTSPDFYPAETVGYTTVTTNTGHAKALRDFLLLLAAASSLLLGRNVSSKDLIAFMTKCKHDQMLPFLTFALGIGVYRLFAAHATPAAPIQHFVTLEDAYARSMRVSMDILVDFSVLDSFLKAHYRKSDSAVGKKLITAGQYHLMLGSRRGMVMGRVNWAAATEIIKPGTRLINSVFLDSIDAKCFGCKSSLALGAFGDFHCTKCDVFYRDDAALQAQLWTSARKPCSLVSNKENGGVQPSSSHVTSKLEEVDVSSLYLQHDFSGLRHLDLRIIPHTRGSGLSDSTEDVVKYSPLDSVHFGTAKWFNALKVFGYISSDDGGHELFVHFNVA